LAHRLWEERGRPEGRAEEDWFEAERRLAGTHSAESKAVDEAVNESFPASDAPASGVPDKAPVNADEHWAAATEAKREKTPRGTSRTATSRSGKNGKGTTRSSKSGSRDTPPRG
jgi:hypothetical protein